MAQSQSLAESAAPVAKDLIDTVPSRTLLMTHAHLEFDVYTPAPSEIRPQPSACSSVYSLQRASCWVGTGVRGGDGGWVGIRVKGRGMQTLRRYTWLTEVIGNGRMPKCELGNDAMRDNAMKWPTRGDAVVQNGCLHDAIVERM